jgi:hypothetical protein
MPFTLFVPPLGTRLLLAEPWDFQLYNERRNATLMALLGDTRSLTSFDPEPIPASLPAGTELIIDRYYIKQNLGEFDSVSFRIAGVSATAKLYAYLEKATKRQVRFWAKLDDVNKLLVELAPEPPPARPRKR